MIHKQIHYCWFGGNELPILVKKCIESWKRFCPDYEIKQWDETNFDIEQHPFVKAAYESGAWAFVSDYARLKIIYDHGGIYLDTDVEIIQSIDKILLHDAFVAREQGLNQINTGLGFGGVKGNIMIKKMLEQYDIMNFDITLLNELACPILNTKPFLECGMLLEDVVETINDCVIFDTQYFCPTAPMTLLDNTTNNTLSIHHYGASWTPKKQQYKRKVVYLLGAKNINKLKKLFSKIRYRGQR